MTELNLLPKISDHFTTTSTSPSFSSHSHFPFSVPTNDQSRPQNLKDKIVVILGATGAGKSRLSVDIATRLPSEIINSDKIQLYKGLEITTNQITIPDRRGVPHHLLGYLRSEDGELTAGGFRIAASNAVSGITSRKKLPIIAGGSNTFVHALLAERFDPKIDSFGSGSICRELRYNCCFVWVDVSETVLFEYLLKRVDEMMGSGMFEELSGFYDPVKASMTRFGIRKAIGVPEFDGYFKMYPPEKEKKWDSGRRAAYDKAVEEIKENTLRLAKRQIVKIEKLRDAGWDIKRVDATASFSAVMMGRRREWREIWEEQVLKPSVKIVNRLLVED
ncbi:adenylate isopentenyltransferase 1, chloroplastic-like [Brassica napus]|uniref:adenylate isopentenyltransferase 1, chloroplastic-like n=1 Tax=Brassica napus TaxID=3708 RepID=UPI0006AAACD7|nr:adenylate isopentenyltransferase 1, chloroplastic-like [Brassica napus]